jgi:AI-2 transport protein TqsA
MILILSSGRMVENRNQNNPMSEATAKATSALVTLAAIVVLVAGMKAASEIIVPFIFSIFIAIIFAPVLLWLTRHRVPNVVAVIIILLGIILIGTLVSVAIGTSVQQFTRALPVYQASLQGQFSAFIALLTNLGVEVSSDGFSEAFDPRSAIRWVNQLLIGLGALFTNAFLIIFTVLFILLEASDFPAKLQAVRGQIGSDLGYTGQFFSSVQRYFGLKTLTSLATGIAVTIMLVIVGVDFPVLWGLVAFLFNYIPNIGSIIAAVPAVLLALVQFGVGPAIGVAAGYVGINMVFGNLLETRIMGKGMGLSALVVFVSLVFWGWVFGSIGMILSVPLTMLAKLALENREDTRWIAVLLGSGAPRAQED